MTEEVIERHEQLFDQTPDVLAADMGFCPDAEKYAELEKRVGRWRSRGGCGTWPTRC